MATGLCSLVAKTFACPRLPSPPFSVQFSKGPVTTPGLPAGRDPTGYDERIRRIVTENARQLGPFQQGLED